MDSRRRFHGGRLCAGITGGGRRMLGEEGNGVGEERAVPEPPLRGDRRMGMDSRRRFHGGGLCARITEITEGRAVSQFHNDDI